MFDMVSIDPLSPNYPTTINTNKYMPPLKGAYILMAAMHE